VILKVLPKPKEGTPPAKFDDCKDYLFFKSKYLTVSWYLDCGTSFIYINIFGYSTRISSAGNWWFKKF